MVLGALASPGVVSGTRVLKWAIHGPLGTAIVVVGRYLAVGYLGP